MLPFQKRNLLEELQEAQKVEIENNKNKDQETNTMNVKKKSKLTFSGFLNALDGIGAPQNTLYFFTTNDIGKLDEALLRPGRIDKIVYFKLASKAQIEGMFGRFFPNAGKMALEYAELIPEYYVSMVEVQGHLLQYKSCPKDAIGTVDIFLQEIKQKREIQKMKN